MSIIPKWHSADSVAETLIDGLRDGSITLHGEPEKSPIHATVKSTDIYNIAIIDRTGGTREVTTQSETSDVFLDITKGITN